MVENLSHSGGSTRFPRILIAESNLSTVESLLHTIEDGRLDLDYDLCGSQESAITKLFRSPPPYQLIISGVHLAAMNDFLLLKHNRTLQPFIPFVVTTSASEIESSRRALQEGAFDLITTPLDHEQTVTTIRLALWHNKLTTLIARKEQALDKYRQHLADYPAEKRMEEAFTRTLSALEESIHSYERTVLRIEESTVCFSDFATKVEYHARRRALERLDALQH